MLTRASRRLTIHVWPGKWNLASIDVTCLAAVMYLQLAFPGRFTAIEETTPESSPSGQLPFISHLGQSVSPLSSICSYLAGLELSTLDSEEDEDTIPPPRPSLDSHLSPTEKCQSVAWNAYIASRLGDLVAHSMYSLHPNYYLMTRPILVSLLPFPQRLYMPDRMRKLQRERLQSAFLWDENEEPQENPRFQAFSRGVEPTKGNDKIQRVFRSERLLEQARDVFETLSRLIPGNDSFLYGENPSSVDTLLAAHLLLLLHAPFPNPIVKTLLLESFPLLVSHALLVHSRAFRSSSTKPYVREELTSSSTVHMFMKSANLWISAVRSGISNIVRGTSQEESASDKTSDAVLNQQMRSGRRKWYIFASVGALVYASTVGFVRIVPSIEDARQYDEEEHVDNGVGSDPEASAV